MKKLLALFFLAIPAFASTNITGVWFGNGQYKLAQQDLWPNNGSSTNTITANFDGHTAFMSGMMNEHIGGMFWLQNNTSSSATLSMTMQPFTNGSNSISSTATICSGTTNYTQREYEIFVSSYVKIEGLTKLSWDPTQYEQRDLPKRFQNPYTVNVNNDGLADSPNLFTTRPDANKFLPEALIPNECRTSVKVSSGNSQGIWLDVYLRKTLTPGTTYTSTISFYDGVVLATSVPISLYVYNATLPDIPALTVIADVSAGDIDYRQNSIAHGSGCATATCVNTRKNYYAFLHRHGITPIGDTLDIATNHFPSLEYQAQLDGSLFSSANGYMGRGKDTASQIYSIETYATWPGANWSSTDASSFCVAVSSWASYFNSAHPSTRSFVYLADETLTNVDKWSTWMATVTACQSSYKVHSWVTSNWPAVNASAPRIDMAATTNFIASGYVQSDWTTAHSKYNTTGSTQAFFYNGHPSWTGTMYATEDDGISPMVGTIGGFKLGINGQFLWQTTNWYNPGNQSPAENLLLSTTSAKTFGFTSSYSATSGVSGFNYANGDGVLLYPGTDTYATSASFGVDGPIASLRLKYVRNGINLYDYATLANAVNPTATSAIISSLVPEIMYEHNCFDPVLDCTYSYGGRSWSDDPNVWEVAREQLAQIAASGAVTTTTTQQWNGPVRFFGGVTLR